MPSVATPKIISNRLTIKYMADIWIPVSKDMSKAKPDAPPVTNFVGTIKKCSPNANIKEPKVTLKNLFKLFALNISLFIKHP